MVNSQLDIVLTPTNNQELIEETKEPLIKIELDE